ncbi:hypothetical protein ACO0K9_01325 [Undibacterium sp. Ji50W]|uniref:hypothetical protein n=1 Tax=Undibacterium sp. Ji50W TaxID=3413041 RepID=UPI003BF08C0E
METPAVHTVHASHTLRPSQLATALPWAIIALAVVAMLVHGPILQFAHYHDFADQSAWRGISHTMDVLSNIGFALAALAGVVVLLEQFRQGGADRAFPALCVFVLALLATTIGSSHYHLAPDDARLFWDRLPIALACCSLLAAVRADNLPGMDARRALTELTVLLFAGFASVLWWQHSGDLRPYLLIQLLSLILIPIWQAIWGSARQTRLLFGCAMLLYVVAKVTELLDAEILHALHIISGHSLKHLLAAAAAGLIVLDLHSKQSRRDVLEVENTKS